MFIRTCSFPCGVRGQIPNFFMPLHTETLPNVLYFKQQESAGVMVRSEDPAFSSRDYKLPLVFIEEEMKINSKVYQKMLQRYVLSFKDYLLETIDVTITEHMRCAIQCYRRNLLVKRTWIWFSVSDWKTWSLERR